MFRQAGVAIAPPAGEDDEFPLPALTQTEKDMGTANNNGLPIIDEWFPPGDNPNTGQPYKTTATLCILHQCNIAGIGHLYPRVHH